MKNILYIVFVVFGAQVFAQKNTVQIKELMKKQELAWNSGDVEGFMKYYWKHDSLRFIGKSGVTYGWQQTLNNYKKSYPDKAAMGQLFFEIKYSEELSENAVFIAGKWSLLKEKPVSGHFTLLWKKIKGEWVIVVDHTS